jgi:hypothetical protein
VYCLRTCPGVDGGCKNQYPITTSRKLPCFSECLGSYNRNEYHKNHSMQTRKIQALVTGDAVLGRGDAPFTFPHAPPTRGETDASFGRITSPGLRALLSGHQTLASAYRTYSIAIFSTEGQADEVVSPGNTLVLPALQTKMQTLFLGRLRGESLPSRPAIIFVIARHLSGHPIVSRFTWE